uniref:Si:ch211-168d1.3 n=1 Tax=Nothobranchius furzeri TaxID=105023 RepID=A0A8C6PHT7_NOTFU
RVEDGGVPSRRDPYVSPSTETSGRQPPEKHLPPSPEATSQRTFSVLDRLLLTHPVWLQLSLNQDSALYILLREPIGVRTLFPLPPFLSVNLFVFHPAFALESSALSFPDLCRLVAFYCISRDVLPFPLQLPEAISKATTHRQLEIKKKRVRQVKDWVLLGKGHIILNSFIQQPQQTNNSASNKRNRFKRSMRLRLSETSMNLSLEGTSTPVDAPPKLQQEQGIEGTVLALERRPAPSLAELDSSSSFSSMDEDNDSDPERESMAQTQTDTYRRPPLVRSRGRGGLHRMSEAFVCFFAPDKRLTRLVEELSRDRRSVFGGMVQDFLLEQRGSLRLFLSRAKCCLLDSRELEPPIETLVPENEKGMNPLCYEAGCLPLRCHLEKAMMALHNQDSSIQRLTQNMLRLKGDAAMEKLGVRTGVPDSREVEKVKQKLTLMQRTHSPIDKVLLLLQVCKYVHKAMGTLHGETEVSWDDLLPSLSYVIVECNRPQLLIEVEYMMELLEPSWLGGEGLTQTLTQKKLSSVFLLLFFFSQQTTRSAVCFFYSNHMIIRLSCLVSSLRNCFYLIF